LALVSGWITFGSSQVYRTSDPIPSIYGESSYLWESTIVPEITLVWEAVADEAKLALLDILLDGVAV